MKTVAYTILHYGAEYLRWAVRSVGQVDEVHIHYSSEPSCGRQAISLCPESRAQLYAEAEKGIEDVRAREGRAPLLRWFDSPPRRYGQHSAYAEAEAMRAGADVVVNIDADEVFEPAALREALQIVRARRGTKEQAIYYRVPFVHYFRSLHWACTDAAMPQRFIDTQAPPSGQRFGGIGLSVPVLHFGYAQSARIVRYKWEIHNHYAEMRPGWFEQVFLPWRPGLADVHPTSSGYWNPKPMQPELIDELLHDHPYCSLRPSEVIP